MPMKLNAGVSRKIGQPNYGSLGASCNVEVELSGSLLFDDPDAFQQHVRQAYATCRQSVDEQLGTGQQPSSTSNGNVDGNGNGNGDAHAEPPSRGNSGNNNGSSNNGADSNNADSNNDVGHANGDGAGAGDGAGSRGATERQVAYIRQLSGQIKGLGIRRLDTLAQNMFGEPLVGLSSLDASGLIDCLRRVRDGNIDLQTALHGAAT